MNRPDQIYLHPFGPDQNTYIRFDVRDSHCIALKIGYGLADQVAGLSNGVRYTLQSSVDAGRSWTVEWDATVTDSAWQEQTLSLVPYLARDVTFQLVVDALGDDSYDWLQSTVRLFPAPQEWDLASNLAKVEVTASDTSLDWDGSRAWLDGSGRPLVTISKAAVQGNARHDQVQFHPFSSGEDTTIALAVKDNRYSLLQTAYALADEVIGRSNGVEYEVRISTDGGKTYARLLEREVSSNVWDSATLDLRPYWGRDLTIQLCAGSKGNDAYDWLQMTLVLVETEDR